MTQNSSSTLLFKAYFFVGGDGQKMLSQCAKCLIMVLDIEKKNFL